MMILTFSFFVLSILNLLVSQIFLLPVKPTLYEGLIPLPCYFFLSLF